MVQFGILVESLRSMLLIASRRDLDICIQITMQLLSYRYLIYACDK